MVQTTHGHAVGSHRRLVAERVVSFRHSVGRTSARKVSIAQYMRDLAMIKPLQPPYNSNRNKSGRVRSIVVVPPRKSLLAVFS